MMSFQCHYYYYHHHHRRLSFAMLVLILLSWTCDWVFGFQPMIHPQRQHQHQRLRGPESSWEQLLSIPTDDILEDDTSTMTMSMYNEYSASKNSNNITWVPRLAFVVTSLFQQYQHLSLTNYLDPICNDKDNDNDVEVVVVVTERKGDDNDNNYFIQVQDSNTSTVVFPMSHLSTTSLSVTNAIVKVLQDIRPQQESVVPKTDDKESLSRDSKFFFDDTSNNIFNNMEDTHIIMWNLTEDLSLDEDESNTTTTTATMTDSESTLLVNDPLLQVKTMIKTNSTNSERKSSRMEIETKPMRQERHPLYSTSETMEGNQANWEGPSDNNNVVSPNMEMARSNSKSDQKDNTLLRLIQAASEEEEVVEGQIDDIALETQRHSMDNDEIPYISESMDVNNATVNDEWDIHNQESSTRRIDTIRRQDAAKITHSFYVKTFRPTWVTQNPHIQTILGVKARSQFMYFPMMITNNFILSQFQWDDRQRVETMDGDFFDVDWKYTLDPIQDHTTTLSLEQSNGNGGTVPNTNATTTTTTPLVLICHGLQSNTNSPLIKDMTIAFNNVGMDVAAINFRGCSGEINRTPMGYHLSYTDDLHFLVEQLSQTQNRRPIYLSGFSLGANVVTKFLADLGPRASEDYNICGAAVNAVPFDLVKCQAINQPGFTGSVYGNNLLRSLQDRILESMENEHIEYNFTREELEQCTTCKEFDDLVVCSVYKDFDNADDYHRKSSTGHRLSEIMVPQLIMQALDDPFFAGNTNPKNDSNQPCRIQYSQFGGHCGFVCHSGQRDQRPSSFMPTELARFVQHVHQVKTGQKSTTVAWRQPQSETHMTPESIQTDLQKASFQEKFRRKQAAIAVSNFEPREFVPAWWARNEHIQTIFGSLFRRQTMYINTCTKSTKLLQSFVQKDDFVWDERQRLHTPDGDFFDVDWKYCVKSDDNGDVSYYKDKPLVLICHGLQSDSSSPLAQEMARAFNNIGMDAGCINFRGCSGEINRTPVGYHLGFTEDLKQMIEWVNDEYPQRRIYLSGFSLGANVVTTCLAELGQRAYDYNIFGAAVNAVPFDMLKANLNLNKYGLTKSLYGGRLLSSMIERVEQLYDHVDFHFPLEEAYKCRTILDMENLVIAPIFGFHDAYDYYEKTSTLPKIDRVAVPEFVIQSEDDPFFVGQSLPKPDSTRPLRMHMTKHGGHCGYVFHSQGEQSYETSWMPTELARFLSHLEHTFFSEAEVRDDFD